ncbi:MAG: dipeptidase [Nostocoides sp.]
MARLERDILVTEPVAQLLRRAPVLDGHNDLFWELREISANNFARTPLDRPLPTTQTDLPRLRAGGVGAQFWSVFVPQQEAGAAAVTATLEQIDAVIRATRAYPDSLVFARTADDVEAAWHGGLIAGLIGAEGGHSINNSLAVLRLLHALGVGYLTLTHNDNVDWADSATDEPVHHGLSVFGRQVVTEMNRLGMFVDLSHVSAETMRDALAVTQAPAIFSHSSAYALCDSPRNVPDDVLASLAAQGGLCMVTFVPKFVNQRVCDWDRAAQAEAVAAGIRPQDYREYSAFTAEFARRTPQPSARLSDVADHIEHIRAVAGINHVGLGGDFDGMGATPEGLEDVSRYPKLVAELVDRGWSSADVAKLTSGNALRVLRERDAVAHALQQRISPSLATFDGLDAHSPDGVSSGSMSERT